MWLKDRKQITDNDCKKMISEICKLFDAIIQNGEEQKHDS